MAGAKIALSTGATAELNQDGSNNAIVNTPGNTAAGVAFGGGAAQAGMVTMQTENDPGTVTGSRYVLSPETSDDYRLRVGVDQMLFHDNFFYSTQNTGKYNFTSAT